jgi:hypothetical protein
MLKCLASITLEVFQLMVVGTHQCFRTSLIAYLEWTMLGAWKTVWLPSMVVNCMNSLHKASKSNVTWLLEFLFTHAMLFATIMLGFLRWRIQHLVLNLSGVYHHIHTCTYYFQPFNYLHYTCKPLSHSLNMGSYEHYWICNREVSIQAQICSAWF